MKMSTQIQSYLVLLLSFAATSIARLQPSSTRQHLHQPESRERQQHPQGYTESSSTPRDLLQGSSTDLDWSLSSGKLLTTGTTLYRESNSHVALSGDGSTVAIGSLQFNAFRGLVRVHRQDPTSSEWNQVGSDIVPENDDAPGLMGTAVSLSQDGTMLAVGSPDRLARVQVYRLVENEWESIGGPLFTNGSIEQDAGFALALSADGRTLVVGAPAFSGGCNGQARVYRLQLDDQTQDENWAQLGQNITSGSRDLAGFSVDITKDGGIIAVGFPYDSLSQGLTFVFQYSEANQEWVPLGYPIVGDNPGDETGYQVALSADASVLAISDGGHKPFDSFRNGRVRVYGLVKTTWTQLGSAILTTENWDEGSFGHGRSLAISADGLTLILAAPGQSDNCYISGLARVFRFVGNDWEPLGQSIDAEKRVDEDFNWGTGWVDISGDGTRILVGGKVENPDLPSACKNFNEEVEGWVRAFDLGQVASTLPSQVPSVSPSAMPVLTFSPTKQPTIAPSKQPSSAPTISQSTIAPSKQPSLAPTDNQPTLPPDGTSESPAARPGDDSSARISSRMVWSRSVSMTLSTMFLFSVLL
mmetsp:Transcript_5446/g.6211  ORF Transcript_5446/g.6211 Transcript_5446/m.6211 type:complete len:586 (+) Transcript_5446:191-1948(+)